MLAMVAGIVLFCAIGCDRESRYKVLTFFFEGVPEPGAKKARRWVSDANTVTMTNAQLRDQQKDGNRAAPVDKLGQRLSSRHDFSRECDKCHTGGMTSGHQELRAPLPDLCYSCHSDLHQKGDYLHGPLYVGECVFCHEPHSSGFIHLQKAPQPDLCLRCHQESDLVLIPGHREALQGVCTDCHDPHGSSVPKLLRVGRVQRGDREQMEELLNLELEGGADAPGLKSNTDALGVEETQDDPNTIN